MRFEAEYDRILEKAEEEYEKEPPSDYYREGYKPKSGVGVKSN